MGHGRKARSLWSVGRIIMANRISEDRWRAKKKKKKKKLIQYTLHNPNSLVLVVVQISECVHFQWSILHILFNAPQNRDEYHWMWGLD